MRSKGTGRDVWIPVGNMMLEGRLIMPHKARGIVVFAHGSGSSRLSPRNNYVARELERNGMGTLLFDLLSEEEDQVYDNRFDISLLSERLLAATSWLRAQPEAKGMKISYFGSSTGSAAALTAAGALGKKISSVVSRGGRPDMVIPVLARVKSPTLLIVGGEDGVVISLNQQAFMHLGCEKEMEIIPGATHLFEEPGALEEVSRLAARWFKKHFTRK